MGVVADLAVELERCSYCNARPGVWCRRYAQNDPEHRGRPTGRASYLHDARTRRLWAWWRAAYEEGIAEGIYRLENRLDRDLARHAGSLTYLNRDIREWIVDEAERVRALIP